MKNLVRLTGVLGAVAGVALCLGHSSIASEGMPANPARAPSSSATTGQSPALLAAEEPVAAAAEAQAKSDMELLFTGKLQQRSDNIKDAVISAKDREGEYIGSGDGTLEGKLAGTIRASSWSGSCLYPLLHKGMQPPEGLHLCTVNPGGFIDTRDGAHIRFDGKGYGLLSPQKYRLSMTMVFATNDPRYQWLTHVLGVMEGEVNAKEGSSVWSVYIPRS
jgi:hypothetical protein